MRTTSPRLSLLCTAAAPRSRLGLSAPDERMLILMDIDQLMPPSAIGLIEQVALTI